MTMIRPTETQVRKMSPFRWVVSKTLLLRAHTKFKMFFLRTKFEGETQISASISFHSINVDGRKKKRRITKKVITYFKMRDPGTLTVSCLARIAV